MNKRQKKKVEKKYIESLGLKDNQGMVNGNGAYNKGVMHHFPMGTIVNITGREGGIRETFICESNGLVQHVEPKHLIVKYVHVHETATLSGGIYS